MPGGPANKAPALRLTTALLFYLAAASIIQQCHAWDQFPLLKVLNERVGAEAGVSDLVKGRWYFDTTRQAPYDESCRLMKARYNVQGDERFPASHHAVWLHKSPTGALWEPPEVSPADFATGSRHGGHGGGGDDDVPPSARHGGSGSKAPTILMYGNSYLRQVFESVFCSYEAEVESALVTARSFDVTFPRTEDPADHVPCDDVHVVPLTENMACHGDSEDVTKFYRGAAPQHDGCNDNVALVRYRGGLRIAYIFRPNIHRSIDCVLGKLGLAVADLDYVFYNDYEGHRWVNGTHGTLQDLQARNPGVRMVGLSGVERLFSRQQKASFGAHFCASNGAYECDKHPGMPGIPDWEARLMLGMALYHEGRAPGGGSRGGDKEEQEEDVELGVDEDNGEWPENKVEAAAEAEAAVHAAAAAKEAAAEEEGKGSTGGGHAGEFAASRRALL